MGATLDGDRPLDCGLERSRVLSRALSARDVPLDPSFGSDDGLWGEVWSQYDHPTREEWPVERTLEPLLAPRPGDRFADLGAGGGYWSLRLARAVGPEGHVFATDISRPLMRRLAWLAQRRGLRQLTAVEVCPEAVGLPDASVDTALMTNVYRFEACNEGDRAYLERVWRALRPGGRFIVVDFERIPGVTPQRMLEHVRAGKETVTQEILAAGFRLREEIRSIPLKENYFLVFERD